MKQPVSAVIIARNEEMIIGHALDAVKDWVDEIILMDMESTDATAQIGRDKGALVLENALVWNFGISRTTGIKKAKNQWILLLDADEIVSPGLAQEISRIVGNDEADLLLLPRANFALSGFPSASGFPEYQPRCFKKDSMKIDDYQGEVHLAYQPKDGIRIKKIAAAFPGVSLNHITNPTLDFLISKINSYSTSEAREQFFTAPKRSGLYIVLSGLKVFWSHYVVRRGYRDGWRGFWLSIVFTFYKFIVFGKLWEMRLHKGKYPTLKEARDEMHRYIADVSKNNPV